MSDQIEPQNLDTRERLLQAAVIAFGRRDYDGVSIREVVEAAGANIAAISYHFGGKRELYLATVAFLADRLHAGMADQLHQAKQAINEGAPGPCAELLCRFLGGFLEQMLAGELGESAPGIIFREQSQPTEAFDILYARLLEPMHTTLASLVACHLGRVAKDREVITLSHALLGQTVIFRIGRTTLLRRLNKPAYTLSDVAQIKAALAGYCRSLLAATHHSSRMDDPS
jgi:TetR/AcrR family transcriptional regulator, regulator of cefoperazone and chloramphenicol sensitivity